MELHEFAREPRVVFDKGPRQTTPGLAQRSCHGGAGLRDRSQVPLDFASGHEASFPTKDNPRLESAAEEDVGLIEIPPFGLHWPTLYEDLSFAEILEKRYQARLSL